MHFRYLHDFVYRKAKDKTLKERVDNSLNYMCVLELTHDGTQSKTDYGAKSKTMAKKKADTSFDVCYAPDDKDDKKTYE